MPITVKIEKTLDDEFISDVLICAFDGGYGGSWYWAAPHRPDSLGGTYLEVMQEDGVPVQPGTWLACHITLDEGMETGKPVWDQALRKGIKVDAEVLRIGIERAIADGYAIADAIAEGDAGQIDANDADAIVQYGIFGEQVYV